MATDEPATILHVDMDAFFASVEQLDHPELRGKPVLVGHDGPRGVVAAASYEARVFGCRSAQPVAVAKRNCPHAIVMPGRFWRYREVSERVFTIFEQFTPSIEPLSIDEAFLDVSGSERLLGTGARIASDIKRTVRAETELTASVGVARNKFLAKLASDLEKPDGLTVFGDEQIESLLPKLPVTRLWGVGPKTAQRLENLGIRTIGDLRAMPMPLLERHVGVDEAEHFRRLSMGLDDRVVTPDREAKSIGQEQTFGTDVADPDAVRAVLLEQVEQVARRVRRQGLRARSMTLKIRYGDFKTITRSATLEAPTDATATLWTAAREIFDAWARADFKPVRLIGATAGQLAIGEGQLALFPDPNDARRRRLDQTLDRITGRFGADAIHRARPTRAENRTLPD